MKVHIVGIGGIGMSGIALILKDRGFDVQGSDIKERIMVKKLRDKGIRVFIGHRAENVEGADVLIHSSAVRENNPEIKEAKRRGIPVIPRSDVLADIMKLTESIAVAGTHGKTTTSSMISRILYGAGLKPTILVGGSLSFLGGYNAVQGEGKWLVAEADESDGTFLKLNPTLSVITNIDADHLDYYGSLENIKEAFLEFANRTSFYGKLFACIDCENTRDIYQKVYKRKNSFGLSKDADFQAKDITPLGLGTVFEVLYREKKLGRVKLNVPGRHNVVNALGAVAVSLEVGIPFNEIAQGLEEFRNARRRMELKGSYNGITFFDDYGHHPTEIEASYRAIKEAFPDRRIVILFQPHRYTRTAALWKEFVRVLKGIDNLYICDIYPAGERPIEGITAETLAKEVGALYCGSLKEAVEVLRRELLPGDVLLTLGAGDVTNFFKLYTGEGIE
ncbi:UDP-N-acetylmuramate--L-alanine ligase [Thermovibrio guaymasensis]|uniref:UDP-N-acetylmuramate--L-alanine ligase n=1 Tax=Thermovibrio guaymasensis TaxID=240167 RepID=A0A420W8Z3_9BACT|nr:UDP-N-acetylmuramate--L-alanine ligase [Thermovibrio guaymasensis]RKQ63742.1 UDP-N-acetylmuramate--L-alanine ligase [Thermovibrio guaymasensis]